MSDKKGRKTGVGVDKNGHATWKGFSNVPLTESMKKEFEAWLKPEMSATTLADQMAMDGYKINLAYNQKNRAFSCAVTCQDPDSLNAGLTMTSLAPSSEYALFLAYWKHVEVCQEKWPQPNEGAGNSQWG